jgi:transmembrane protein EpsG
MATIFNLERTSYWLLLIWLFGAGILLKGMPQKEELVSGRVRQRWFWFSAILLTLPYVLWTGYRTGGADTAAYARAFHNISPSLASIPGILFSDGKDTGFTVLMVLIKACGITQYQHFFLIIAAFQMCCMVYTFRRYSQNFWFSIFLFVASTDFMSWMHNGMRQFIAVCMTFAAFELMLQRKYIRFVLIVVIAAQIHGSAYIMLPLAYIMQGKAMNRKTLLTIVGAALCIPFIDRFTPILETLMADTQYGDIMTNDLWIADDGTNIIRVAVYSAPALVVFFGWRYLVNSTDPAINQCINASIITMAIYLVSMVTSGIYVGRLPIYTTLHGYMVLPWVIDQIFEESSARLVKVVAVIAYLGFFYFQMGIGWGLL